MAGRMEYTIVFLSPLTPVLIAVLSHKKTWLEEWSGLKFHFWSTYLWTQSLQREHVEVILELGHDVS